MTTTAFLYNLFWEIGNYIILSRFNSSSAPVKSSCVYTFRVVLISECPIRCSNVLGFIPYLAILVQCAETILVAKKVENLKKIYEAVFKDAIKIPSMQDKKLKEYIITKLRENGDLKRIYRNIFISYITKNLDNYIKYFDEALQWVKKNNIKSDEMAQWIKENNIQ